MKGTQSKSAMAQRMEADRMTATASYGTPSKSEYKGTGLGAHRHRVELGDNEHNRRSSEHSRTSEASAASTRSSSSSSHSMTDGTSLEKKKKLPRKDSPWLENGHDAMDAIALARTASSKRDEYRVRRVRSRCICTPIQTGS